MNLEISMPPGAFTSFTIELGNQVAELQAMNASPIDFRFYSANFSQLRLRSSTIPSLDVSVTSVLEPSSLALLGLGITGSYFQKGGAKDSAIRMLNPGQQCTVINKPVPW